MSALKTKKRCKQTVRNWKFFRTEKLRLNQRESAKMIGMSFPTLRDIEASGMATPESIETLEKGLMMLKGMKP